MVVKQGGSFGNDDYPVLVSHAALQYDIQAYRSGYISEINTTDIGKAALELGAGRKSQDDIIDYSAGLIMKKKLGDHAKKGEVIATLLHNSPVSLNEAINIASKSFTIADDRPERRDLILKVYESGQIW